MIDWDALFCSSWPTSSAIHFFLIWGCLFKINLTKRSKKQWDWKTLSLQLSFHYTTRTPTETTMVRGQECVKLLLIVEKLCLTYWVNTWLPPSPRWRWRANSARRIARVLSNNWGVPVITLVATASNDFVDWRSHVAAAAGLALSCLT